MSKVNLLALTPTELSRFNEIRDLLLKHKFERMPSKLRADVISCLTESQFAKYRFTNLLGEHITGISENLFAGKEGAGFQLRLGTGSPRNITDPSEFTMDFTVTLDPKYAKSELCKWWHIPTMLLADVIACSIACEEITDEELEDVEFIDERLSTWAEYH